MSGAFLLLTFLTLQRLSELVVSARNARSLFARGAYEAGKEQYPLLIAFHIVWSATLWFFGLRQNVNPAFLPLLVALQCARFWTQRTLGERWTTRIIVLPGVPPITRGPYRFLRHPNYAVVALELPCISLTLGLVWHACVFGVVNLALLRARARVEDAALNPTRA